MSARTDSAAVIFTMTGKDGAEDHNEVARMLGARWGFRKPVQVKEILEAIQNVVEPSRGVSRSATVIPRHDGGVIRGFAHLWEEVTMTKDVVCSMQVDEKTAQNKSEYKGKTFAFCSPACKTKFDQKPEAYASKAVQAGQ